MLEELLTRILSELEGGDEAAFKKAVKLPANSTLARINELAATEAVSELADCTKLFLKVWRNRKVHDIREFRTGAAHVYQ